MSLAEVLRRLAPLLPSLIAEDGRGRPGAAVKIALAAAKEEPGEVVSWQVAAACACLVAGEPLRALTMLDAVNIDDAETGRQVRALQVWAMAAAYNLYPDGAGAELPPNFPREALVLRGAGVPSQNPETVLLEALTSSITGLLSARSLLNNPQMGATPIIADVAQDLRRRLSLLADFACSVGATSMARWATIARADIASRMGQLDLSLHELGVAREVAETDGDALTVAQSWQREGDWFATPGSAPEILGLRLEDQSVPTGSDRQDNTRAARAYAKAADRLQGVDAPRAQGALALRRALLAGRSGGFEDQQAYLRDAVIAFAEAGDAGGIGISCVHQWLAALQRGALRSVRIVAPLEWNAPHGALKSLVDWASTRGSPSMVAGLGRLLQRAGENWTREGKHEAAELALRLAHPLLALNEAIPSWEIPEALARLDTRRGLHARAIVRRLQILDRLPPPPDPAANLHGWLSDVWMTSGLVTIPTGISGIGTIAIDLVERGAIRLRQLLECAGLKSAELPVPMRDPDELLRQFAETIRTAPETALKNWASNRNFGADQRLMLLQAAAVANETLKLSAPMAALLRARLAQRSGWEEQAGAWYRAAYTAASQLPKSARWLEVLVLQAWNRPDQTLAAWQALATDTNLPVPLRATLALRAGDGEGARALLASLPEPAAEQPAGASWQGWLCLAEVALAVADTSAAVVHSLRAIDDFEHWLGTLVRDADRLDACDDVSVNVLYNVAVRSYLALAKAAEDEPTAGGAAGHRAAAFALAERHRSLLLPAAATPLGINGKTWRDWQMAASQHTTAYQRLLGALITGARQTGQPDRPPPGEAERELLAAAEQKLADIEVGLSDEELSIIRDAQTPKGIGADITFRLQQILPPGCALLLTAVAADDIASFCLTTAALRCHSAKLAKRLEGPLQRLLRACANGATAAMIQMDAELLSSQLLAPFAVELSACDRLIVVADASLQALPWHLLPLNGAPLGASLAISILPAATLLLRDGIDRPLAEGERLVVGDPAFDPVAYPGLRRLPGAAQEAGAVARLWQAMPPYIDADARKETLCSLMPGRALLHLAAHGRLDNVAPYDSSIVLSGRDELTVSDLIGLQLDTDLVVLSACDTGRGTATLGGDLIGLGRGLLTAGVRRHIVSLWPVDDMAACVTMVALHECLKAGLPPALALAEAQREMQGLNAAALTARYASLGGSGHETSVPIKRGHVMRALPAYPEPDSDIAEHEEGAISGSDPSIWGAFVLMGC
jgi:CHAT domain-containing protein